MSRILRDNGLTLVLLALFVASIVGTSLTLLTMGKTRSANFVSQWVPSFLLLGFYNKLVKLHGSESA